MLPYCILYDNTTGRVVLAENKNCNNIKNDYLIKYADLDKKFKNEHDLNNNSNKNLDDLMKYADLDKKFKNENDLNNNFNKKLDDLMKYTDLDKKYNPTEQFTNNSVSNKEEFSKKSFNDLEDFNKKYNSTEQFTNNLVSNKEEFSKKSFNDLEDFNKKLFLEQFNKNNSFEEINKNSFSEQFNKNLLEENNKNSFSEQYKNNLFSEQFNKNLFSEQYKNISLEEINKNSLEKINSITLEENNKNSFLEKFKSITLEENNKNSFSEEYKNNLLNVKEENNKNSFSEEYKNNLIEEINKNSFSEYKNNLLNVKEEINNSFDIEESNLYENKIIKKDLTYGIKKTILSDFNYLYNSSNSNDFKIGINKNTSQINTIFDTFYILPNISEINTKNETNIVNEKKVELFKNIYDPSDKQYFPLDYIACGNTIPLKTPNNIYFKKLIIKNIFWNVFQSIDMKEYKTSELLCLVPDKNEYIYKKIELQINIELHSQIPQNFINSNILPYKNDKVKNVNSATTCLYKIVTFNVDTLNGSKFENIIIDLVPDIILECALLCIKISIPDKCIEILKGIDKYNKIFYGFVPFSQIVLNFDYELSI
jgi:hypothetical protein